MEGSKEFVQIHRRSQELLNCREKYIKHVIDERDSSGSATLYHIMYAYKIITLLVWIGRSMKVVVSTVFQTSQVASLKNVLVLSIKIVNGLQHTWVVIWHLSFHAGL